jgi:hypothetical protein
MSYIAKWHILIPDAKEVDLDPVDLARRALDLMRVPHRNRWLVEDLATGEQLPVDLKTGVIHYPDSPRPTFDDDEPPF